MTLLHHADMPKDFVERVYQALRNWHARNARALLDDLLLERRVRAERGKVAPRLCTNQILLEGIDCLSHIDQDAANLLRWRFLDQEKADKVARRQSVSEDAIFQLQCEAIAKVAEIIWDQEAKLRLKQAQQIESRLESSAYSQLFGVIDKMSEARAQLINPAGPWLLALEGTGGVGKTSLAGALVREFARDAQFYDIAWVSARRRFSQLSGESSETLASQSGLTLVELVDCLIDQFSLAGLKQRPDAEKLRGVKEYLRDRPCLIVLDNLEAASDYRTLMLQLAGWVNPSKFLVTTCHSLRDVSDVYVLTLKQLSREDTLALIRYEAQTRGLQELGFASDQALDAIYEVTGGNPLAIRLFIGQVHTHALPVVLNHFSHVTGKPVEELLLFLHQAAWQLLDLHSCRLLQVMALTVEEECQLEKIVAAAELDESTAAACLYHLVALSLVNVGGNLGERCYFLHPITQAFVSQQPLDDSLL